ncbi:LADA_0B01970g1_1 [Lachancea dasiensis]|uniref:LADA_0B01970g1_1 n=1 Tax=Lachancea dasiensis TaxID=1072105 RepID=A0A1G4IS20_9SACH|nr:LADA_0B01970g1_1 [Lachancea dasiensis]
MGVHSLWDIVGPTAKPVRLESLTNKRLAVDASIWIYQFMKAVRDKEGNAMRYSHVVGFYRRICKLLYFGVKPVFVFDGGAPTLKRRTIQQRKERRQGRRDNAANTARKLLARQLQKEKLPIAGKDMSSSSQTHIHKLNDEYDLPKIPGFKYEASDARINADDFKTIMDNIDELDGVDLDSINPASKEFDELPKSTQYMLLSALRLKSRLRMGYSREQLQSIFPDSMDFSKFQIDMVKRRNFFTQKLMNATNTHDGGASKLDREPNKRVAGQRHKEYELIRTDNGWTLSLTGDDGSEVSKAIVVDERPQKASTQDLNSNNGEDDSEDIDWEDIDLDTKESNENLDYSVKASLLPIKAATLQTGGGQSFLDKRHLETGPEISRKIIHIPDETVEGNSGVSSSIHGGQDANDEDDEYADLTRDLQIMQSIARNNSPKINSNPTTQLHQTVNRSDPSNNSKIQRDTGAVSEYDNAATGNSQAMEPSSGSNEGSGRSENENNRFYEPARVPTESEQNLQFVIDKLEVPGDRSGKQEVEKVDNQAPESTETQIPEIPDWFKSNGPSDFNPHLGSSFLTNDSSNGTAFRNDDERIGLFSGSAASDFISVRRVEQDDHERRKEPNEDDVLEVFPKSPNSISGSPSEVKDPKVVAVEEELQNTPAPVVDYDFSEDEEDALIHQLREEEQDYHLFKTALNPTSASTTFMDEVLTEEQLRDKRDSDEVTAAMVAEVQDLLTRFGIPYMTAPMEAEAQCAELLILKLVDGIITDDSDIFLFGGDKVYKNMFHEKNYVEFYQSAMISRELGLDREKFIELAQLLGSDYTTGVKGIGPVSAMEILAEFGDLTAFRDWYNEGQFSKRVQEKEPDFEKKLRRKLANGEVMLNSDFPSDLVKEAYIRPEVDHDTTKFSWGVPDLDRLRSFFGSTVGWPQEKTDEVMIPLIREVNNRKKTGIQNSLSNFFPTEYIKAGKDLKLGKRIKNASGKLKLKKRRTE